MEAQAYKTGPPAHLIPWCWKMHIVTTRDIYKIGYCHQINIYYIYKIFFMEAQIHMRIFLRTEGKAKTTSR